MTAGRVKFFPAHPSIADRLNYQHGKSREILIKNVTAKRRIMRTQKSTGGRVETAPKGDGESAIASDKQLRV